jgi:hypothetical protein
MLQGFGLEQMEPARRVKSWFDGHFKRYPFTPEAIEYFRTLRLEAGDLSAPHGGGFWWDRRNLVQIRGAQDEAALHELSHAWWHHERLRGNNAREMMDAVVRLARESDPRYAAARQLADYYVNGIPSQPDPSSPTGYWRGMLVEDNDWEMFAGLASGTMGDMQLLPPYVRRFYVGLFEQPPTA